MQQLVSRLVDPDSVDREHCEVIGVAELNGHLYVLQNKSKSIHVSLADKPYTMLSDVLLDGVIEPTDLAASIVDSCIYVTDIGESGCIWRVRVEERVAERSLEHVELKLDQNASDFEGRSTEPLSTRTESAQGSDKGHDREVKQLNSTDVSAAGDATGINAACAAEPVASVAESVSIASVGEQNEKQPISKTQEEANKLQQPHNIDSEQHKQAGIDLQELIRMISGSQVSAVNVTEVAHHSKPDLPPACAVELTKDEDAGEMIRSLLERNGLMTKIAERGNAGPCVFEISRHYDVKRFLFNVDIFLQLELLVVINVSRQSCLGLLIADLMLTNKLLTW